MAAWTAWRVSATTRVGSGLNIKNWTFNTAYRHFYPVLGDNWLTERCT